MVLSVEAAPTRVLPVEAVIASAIEVISGAESLPVVMPPVVVRLQVIARNILFEYIIKRSSIKVGGYLFTRTYDDEPLLLT